eukprot:Protomagalhaensia_sp_Gyna_25__2834@NODE_2645_length_968_cov_466_454252_g2204_i0_p1_GENE_NODE_2645_length_968_cov_466_454252_g2204_i0NODE_2645_length_968_cov_466_454252_g2204_i0_p1_ORF_typecomplete_len229_score37_86_NODE_2645_length_968_cov_466_454252_g2204_i0178864
MSHLKPITLPPTFSGGYQFHPAIMTKPVELRPSSAAPSVAPAPKVNLGLTVGSTQMSQFNKPDPNPPKILSIPDLAASFAPTTQAHHFVKTPESDSLRGNMMGWGNPAVGPVAQSSVDLGVTFGPAQMATQVLPRGNAPTGFGYIPPAAAAYGAQVPTGVPVVSHQRYHSATAAAGFMPPLTFQPSPLGPAGLTNAPRPGEPANANGHRVGCHCCKCRGRCKNWALDD